MTPSLSKKDHLKIQALQRALLIESNEPEERTQEANHYNWLDDQNEMLKARIRELEAENALLKKYRDRCIPPGRP